MQNENKEQSQQSEQSQQKQRVSTILPQRDLFNNPMVQSARASLNPKDIDMYKEWGEKVYKHFNFDDPRQSNRYDPLSNIRFEIVESLKSGLDPNLLSDNEKNIMIEFYGYDWQTIVFQQFENQN